MWLIAAKLVLGRGGSAGGQDRAEVFETADGVIVVVADGAGGTAGGAQAADHVIGAVRSAVATSRDGMIDACALLRRADDDLASHGTGERTAVIVAVTATGITGASVGDSGAWLVREGRPRRRHRRTGAQAARAGLAHA